MQMVDILLKYILWHKFWNDLDAQRDFDKKIVTKKLVKYNHSYLKYALTRKMNLGWFGWLAQGFL